MDLIKKRLRLQESISNCISDLNKTKPENIDQSISDLLKKLCYIIKADSCKILIKDNLKNKYCNYYKYSKPGINIDIPSNFNITNESWVPLDKDINSDHNSIILKDIKKNDFSSNDASEIKSNMRILLMPRSGDDAIFDFSSASIVDEWDYEIVPSLRVLGEAILNIVNAIKTEGHLQFSERKYHDLINMSLGLIYKCNDKSEFTFLNSAWEKTLGYSIDEMLGKSFIEFMPKSINSRYMKTHKNIYKGSSVNGYETIFLTKDGKERTMIFTGIPEYDNNGEVIGTQGTGIDITERKCIENELIDSRDKLRQLAARLSQKEQQQSKELASIIHDSLGQEIAMLKVNLGRLTNMELNSKAQEIISQTRERLESMLNITRDLIQNLYPPVLTEMGLFEAIKWFGEKISKENNLNFEYIYNCKTGKLKEEISQSLYLIVKELLVNIVKHANASRITVKTDYLKNELFITIEDDGKGFAFPEKDAEAYGFGLINTKERVFNLKGKFEIFENNPGALILIWVPISGGGA